MDRLNGISHGLGYLRHLEAGIGRIATAVVKEITNVMRAKYVEQAFVLGAVFLDALQLVAAGAERAGRRMLESGDCRGGTKDFRGNRSGARQAIFNGWPCPFVEFLSFDASIKATPSVLTSRKFFKISRTTFV